MRRLIVVLASSLSCVVGCAAACDEGWHARNAAGSGAVDCGFAPLGDDRTAVLACADDAIARGAAFVAGWGRQGRDTAVSTYVAENADGARWMLGFDGGLGVGHERLTATRCATAWRHFVDAFGHDSLTCDGDGSAPVVVCGE